MAERLPRPGAIKAGILEGLASERGLGEERVLQAHMHAPPPAATSSPPLTAALLCPSCSPHPSS